MSFDAAIARVAGLSNVGDRDKLNLYGLFKQARHGDADEKSAPSRFNVVQYAKYSAWKELKGLSTGEAEEKYVALVKKLDPSWKPVETAAQTRPRGEIFSKENGIATSKVSSNAATANGTNSHPSGILQNGKQQVLPAVNLSVPSKPRTMSLDQNFSFSLKATSTPPKLSKALERALYTPPVGGGDSTRPRSRSLEMFIVDPLLSDQEVGRSVRRLVSTNLSATGGESDRDNPDFRTETVEMSNPIRVPVDQQRRVMSHLKSVGNMRDLGGLPAIQANGQPGRTKFGVLFRCAQLSHTEAHDAKHLIETVGLKTIVDLRSTDAPAHGPLYEKFETLTNYASSQHGKERALVRLPLISRTLVQQLILRHAPVLRRLQLFVLFLVVKVISFVRKLFAALPIAEIVAERILLPLEKYVASLLIAVSRKGFVDSGLAALYERILLDGREELKKALEAFTHPDHVPSAVHCAFGKDRTGVVCAIVLLAAGTPRQVVLEDFAMSHEFLDTELGQKEWAHSLREMPELKGQEEEWARSPLAYMKAALQVVDREYGSVDRYLQDVLGLGDAWTKQVRTLLVEPE